MDHAQQMAIARTWAAARASRLSPSSVLDTNFRAVSGGKNKQKDGKPRNFADGSEEKRKLSWLEEELKKPRATWTDVAGTPSVQQWYSRRPKPLQAAFEICCRRVAYLTFAAADS